jgi:hypothetical protein
VFDEGDVTVQAENAEEGGARLSDTRPPGDNGQSKRVFQCFVSARATEAAGLITFKVLKGYAEQTRVRASVSGECLDPL